MWLMILEIGKAKIMGLAPAVCLARGLLSTKRIQPSCSSTPGKAM